MFSARKRSLGVTLKPGFDAADLTFTFHGGGHDEFTEAVHTSLERKAWEATDVRARTGGVKASSAGISGLMRKQEKERRETGKLADEAFSDLKALMNKTRDVVSRDWLHLLRRPRPHRHPLAEQLSRRFPTTLWLNRSRSWKSSK